MFSKYILIYMFFSHYHRVKSQDVGANDDCECVHASLCKNNDINKNGEGIIDVRESVIDLRIKSDDCDSYLDVCCTKENIDLRPAQNFTPTGCGFRNPDGVGFRITGGTDNEAQFGEFPWMVAVFQQSKPMQKHIYQCGGSLIHPKVVLTAAHCLNTNAKYKIRVGEWDSQTIKENWKHQDMNVNELVIHPDYSGRIAVYNNIALLILESEVFLTKHVNVACLPPQDYEAFEDNCVVTGWGRLRFEEKGAYQTILKRIELPIMSRSKCQDAFRNTRLGQRFNLHKSFICAGGEKEKDACTGDGGGPLVCPINQEENRYQQVGIVAWGIGCGNRGVPGAYVNVARYRRWIDDNLRIRNLYITSKEK